MWLINVHTLELEFPLGGLKYAILSHRWQDEEVSYQEFTSRRPPTWKKGYRKIEAFCAKAAKHGYRWGWVDTCCINKESSAELAEAINSMYTWYAKAEVCYAYLVDVDLDESTKITSSE
jgi:hypothetical protein